MAGERFRLADEVRYIQRRAAAGDSRILTIAQLVLFSLYLSFTGWALDQALLGGRFVGLANYEDLLNDPSEA